MTTSPVCPSFLDKKFCEDGTSSSVGPIKEFTKTTKKGTSAGHNCSYPDDSFGAANLTLLAWSKGAAQLDSRNVPAWCGHCFDDAHDPQWGSGAVFCYADASTGLIHAANVKYDLNRQGADSKPCHAAYAIPPKGGDWGSGDRPAYFTFTTAKSPPAECIVKRGVQSVRAPRANGACCAATLPPRRCYAEGNGDCPDAGSTTQCENPAPPGKWHPWSCEWADGAEQVWVQQRRYELPAKAAKLEGAAGAAEPRSSRIAALRGAVPQLALQ
eukprot:g293.t1